MRQKPSSSRLAVTRTWPLPQGALTGQIDGQLGGKASELVPVCLICHNHM